LPSRRLRPRPGQIGDEPPSVGDPVRRFSARNRYSLALCIMAVAAGGRALWLVHQVRSSPTYRHDALNSAPLELLFYALSAVSLVAAVVLGVTDWQAVEGSGWKLAVWAVVVIGAATLALLSLGFR
jgi:hypothetical protein